MSYLYEDEDESEIQRDIKVKPRKTRAHTNSQAVEGAKNFLTNIFTIAINEKGVSVTLYDESDGKTYHASSKHVILLEENNNEMIQQHHRQQFRLDVSIRYRNSDKHDGLMSTPEEAAEMFVDNWIHDDRNEIVVFSRGSNITDVLGLSINEQYSTEEYMKLFNVAHPSSVGRESFKLVMRPNRWIQYYQPNMILALPVQK